jgi:hypothetical protein
VQLSDRSDAERIEKNEKNANEYDPHSSATMGP